ncbi:MAG TPA: IclR family transcriptional regulator [Solirubrobacteraceae bacterium]|jgi:DNA-binding IclR family transcriptional regulator
MGPGTPHHAVDLGVGGPVANRSVERACRLLSAFSIERPFLTLAELAGDTELPKATAHRLAAALRACGFLTQTEDGRYGLGVKLLELGAVLRESMDVVQLCSRAMNAIAAASGETVLLVTVDWERCEVLLVARRNSPHPLAVGTLFGRPQPIPPGGALGQALLAGLSPSDLETVIDGLHLVATTPKTPIERRLLLRHIARAREMGFASEQDEFIEGGAGVAVPVIFEEGRPLAAIGVVGPTSRLADKVPSLGALLLDSTVTLRPAQPEGRVRSARQ